MIKRNIWGCYAGVVLVLIALVPGCVSTPVPIDASVEALIEQLHTSTIQNRMARIKLVQRGPEVVPQLMAHLNVPAHKLRRGDSALRAARVLRVLREINPPEMLPVCERILLKRYIPPGTKEAAAVLNEAIACVYAQFPAQKARDIYYQFVTGDARQYMKTEIAAGHWGTGGMLDRLAVDVLTGFSLMVQAQDLRTQDALSVFLERISGGAMSRMYFHQLAENGFTITEYTTAKDRAELERIADTP